MNNAKEVAWHCLLFSGTLQNGRVNFPASLLVGLRYEDFAHIRRRKFGRHLVENVLIRSYQVNY